MQIIQSIQNKIYVIRGERVMLDRDLADLYQTQTKALNLAVKSNIRRFPADFMFQLTHDEYEALRLHFETLEQKDATLSRLQNETINGTRGRHSKYLPYAFTEQGVAMRSGILHSERAIQMNIAIMPLEIFSSPKPNKARTSLTLLFNPPLNLQHNLYSHHLYYLIFIMRCALTNLH